MICRPIQMIPKESYMVISDAALKVDYLGNDVLGSHLIICKIVDEAGAQLFSGTQLELITENLD